MLHYRILYHTILLLYYRKILNIIEKILDTSIISLLPILLSNYDQYTIQYFIIKFLKRNLVYNPIFIYFKIYTLNFITVIQLQSNRIFSIKLVFSFNFASVYLRSASTISDSFESDRFKSFSVRSFAK